MDDHRPAVGRAGAAHRIRQLRGGDAARLGVADDPLARSQSREGRGVRVLMSGLDYERVVLATERRIGEGGLFTKKRPTLLFNGYEAQVGQLYAGMDLTKNF